MDKKSGLEIAFEIVCYFSMNERIYWRERNSATACWKEKMCKDNVNSYPQAYEHPKIYFDFRCNFYLLFFNLDRCPELGDFRSNQTSINFLR